MEQPICTDPAGQRKRTDRHTAPRRLCFWLLVHLVGLAPAASQICRSLEQDVLWAEQDQQYQHRYDDEQCLCGIPAYAHFYSRAFGRNSCHGSATTSGGSLSRQVAPVPDPSPQPRWQQPPGAGNAGSSSGTCGTEAVIKASDDISSDDSDDGDSSRSAGPATMPPGASDLQASSPDSNPADARGDSSVDVDRAAVDPERLIIRFDHYAPADDHRVFLSGLLGAEGPDSWTWVPRSNPAARFPTDFGLLAPAPGQEGALRRHLAAAGGVRDVHPDKRYTGKLAWVPEGRLRDIVLDLGAGAAEAAAGGQDAAEGGVEVGLLDEAVFSVSRRPGRIVTRFSTEHLAGDADPEALMEAAQQRAWRTGAGGGGGGGDDPGLGLGVEGGEEEGGGMTRSGRRVASVPRHSGGSGSSGGGSGRGQADDRSRVEGRAGSGAQQHRKHHEDARHRDVAPTGHEREQRAGRQQHQQRHLRQREDMQHHHNHQQQHQQQQYDAANGAAGGATGGGDGSGDSAAAAAPHTGRMGGGHLNLGEENSSAGSDGGDVDRWRRRLHLQHAQSGTVPVMMQADRLWKQGYSGKGVRVGIFDTGIRSDHPHIRNIRERTNWTHQNSLSDGLGHGSFVAGVVGGQDHQCPGFAPDVELFTFKVFTDDQVSFTSWFLDAFNYAIIVRVHVINLSIGGPDFLDQPFVDKVLEVTSNGVLLVSAIGNDGPLYGTLNNPADQNDVIGVGGIDNWDSIASFSSRGMSTWELPRGYGRVKPDVMAYAKDVQGSKMQGGCRSLSGTSVASPVVAGAVSLLASTVPEEQRWELLNPASMKQALVEGAVRLNNLNIYEQGSGRINLINSMAVLQSYKPRASVIPAKLDLTDCPYMWPFCRQHLYAGALPVLFNATLLNGQGVAGWLEGPPVWRPRDAGGRLLHLDFEWSATLWPWSGFLALYIRVHKAGAAYDGVGNGVVECVVVSAPGPGEEGLRRSVVQLPVRARIGPTPPRSRRLLWDQFHSLKYPPAYLPRDNLDIKTDILDWHGDHPHTNFHGLYNALRDQGYFLEVLGSPATCFDASQYGALLIVDSEEEWYPAEVAALEAAVSNLGLSLLVFADWYNVASLDQMRFFDDNTRSWWNPATGGAHVPGLNDLLAPYGMALGDAVIHGTTTLAGVRVVINHGSDIAKVPKGGWLHRASLSNAVRRGGAASGQHGFLGAVTHGSAGGHVVVFADSNCLDRSHMTNNCYELVMKLLARVLDQQSGQGVLDNSAKLDRPYVTPLYNFTMPARRPASEYNFTAVSYVLSHPQPSCFPNAACVKLPDYPACQNFLAAENATAASANSDHVDQQPSTASGDAIPDGLQVPGLGGDRRSNGGGGGTVLLVHPDGGSPPTSLLQLGLSSTQLLVLGCLLFLGLFLGLWVVRMGPGRGVAAAAGSGSSGGSGAAVGGARRTGLGAARLRVSDV